MDYSLLPPLPEGAKHVSIIPEYEHLFGYAAMPDGTILTCKPKVNSKKKYLDYWREKKLCTHQFGYWMMQTKTKASKTTDTRVHRIICRLFVENPHNYNIVNHKDGNKKNNHYTNLEWCTIKMNVNHALDNNFRDTARGTRIKHAILNDNLVVEIFKLKSKCLFNEDIGDMLNVSKSVICSVLSRRSWKHVFVSEELIKGAQFGYSKTRGRNRLRNR